MGTGASTSQLPESINKELAKSVLGDKFDEAKFDAAAKDGAVEKSAFLAAIAEAGGANPAEAASDGATDSATAMTKEGEGAKPAEGGGDAAADADAGSSPSATSAASASYPADPVDVPKADIDALHSQVRWNKDHPEITRVLTENAAMVHARDAKNGNYPLHIAAQNNHVDLVKLLLEHKADPNKQNLAGQAALHMTSTYELKELCDILVAAGADPSLKNGDGHMAKNGLEGKANERYGELSQVIEKPTEATLLAWFDGVLTNPENLDKTAIMKVVNFQEKKKMKANGSWTDAVNAKFTEMIRALP